MGASDCLSRGLSRTGVRLAVAAAMVAVATALCPNCSLDAGGVGRSMIGALSEPLTCVLMPPTADQATWRDAVARALGPLPARVLSRWHSWAAPLLDVMQARPVAPPPRRALALAPPTVKEPGPPQPPERPVQIPGRPGRAALVESTRLIRASQARRTYGVTGAGLTVAVLDSGLRTSHVDFAGRVLAQRNFTNDYGGDPDKAWDELGHGTHVAGVICANGVHTGIAPGANIIPLKVFPNEGSGEWEWIVKALQWVLDNHERYSISVCNYSGGDHLNHLDCNESDQMRGLIRELRARNVAVVTTAGNAFYGCAGAQGMEYPGIMPEIVSVGAVYDADIGGPLRYGDGAEAHTTDRDRITPFSQRLHWSVHPTNRTDIFAPGGNTTSSGILDDRASSDMHGTSMAAPHVAGVVLLLQQRYRDLTGSLPTVDQIETWLRAGGVSIIDGDDEDDNAVNTGLDYLRVDAANALAQVVSALGRGARFAGFEEGEESQLTLLTGNDAPWFITSGTAHGGASSVQAAAIGHDQSTSLWVEVECTEGVISFHRCVSSEEGYDWLSFYVDDELRDQWSGAVPWNTIACIYAVSAGKHVFKWEYSKDDSVSTGLDTAWVDDIEVR